MGNYHTLTSGQDCLSFIRDGLAWAHLFVMLEFVVLAGIVCLIEDTFAPKVSICTRHCCILASGNVGPWIWRPWESMYPWLGLGPWVMMLGVVTGVCCTRSYIWYCIVGFIKG
jgi:hypothetical protein